jgi:hypothetical protein
MNTFIDEKTFRAATFSRGPALWSSPSQSHSSLVAR